MDATIHVYTFKEGLLGKLAHDLRLTLTRFEIRVQGEDVSAVCAADALRVDGAMHGGMLAHGQLSAADKQKIGDNLANDVLRTHEHPEVRFRGRVSGPAAPYSLSGELVLCGVARPLALQLRTEGDRLVGELELKPSAWGIRPFRALGGALKVQDRVRIAISASQPTPQVRADLDAAEPLVWQPAA